MAVKFERQHFNALAVLFAEAAPPDNESMEVRIQWADTISLFCDYFEASNPLFDRMKFQAAIGKHLGDK